MCLQGVGIHKPSTLFGLLDLLELLDLYWPSLQILIPDAGSGVDAAEVMHRTQGLGSLGSLPLLGRYRVLY